MGVRGDFFAHRKGKPHFTGNGVFFLNNRTNAFKIPNRILSANGISACGIGYWFFEENGSATLCDARRRKESAVGTNARPLDSVFEYFDQQLWRLLAALRVGGDGVCLRRFATRFAKRMVAFAVRAARVRAYAGRAAIAWIYGAAQPFARRFFLWLLRLFKVFLPR